MFSIIHEHLYSIPVNGNVVYIEIKRLHELGSTDVFRNVKTYRRVTLREYKWYLLLPSDTFISSSPVLHLNAALFNIHFHAEILREAAADTKCGLFDILR